MQLAAGDARQFGAGALCPGVCLDQCGSTQTMVGHRFEATTKVCGEWRQLLATPALSVCTTACAESLRDGGRASACLGDIEVATQHAQCCRAAMDEMGCRMPKKTGPSMDPFLPSQESQGSEGLDTCAQHLGQGIGRLVQSARPPRQAPGQPYGRCSGLARAPLVTHGADAP